VSDVPLVPEQTVSLPKLGSAEGLLSWVASVDHKQIGIMYLAASFAFFLIGGFEALLMRVQLGAPNSTFLSPDAYNQLFTMHGTTMIFLVVMPMLIGFGNYLTPLMIGARDVAFPRLNALSLWLFVFGGLLLYFSFVAGGAPDAGWFAYPPLSEQPYSTGVGMGYWAVSLLVIGIGSVVGAINLIVTILKLRAPGMGLLRVPLLVWMTLINSLIILFALPSLNATLAMVLLDRKLGAHFFEPLAGGSPLLYQHYFWSFGHPEVYIMILPAFGIISEVIPVFSRKPIYGYGFVAGSTVAIAFYSFAVWGHHMWAAGMGFWPDILFAVGTFLIAVPTGVKIFNWLATAWGGSVRFTTSMLFALAFLLMFTMGGVTGVQFAVVPFDRQVTDTYYVVAHLHYVLFGGSMFAIFAGFYYWFPKVTGRMLSEKIGKLNFWLTLIGFNLTFFVQHILGWIGMTRRVWTYPDLPWWGALNLVSSIGSFVLGAAVLVFAWNVYISLRHGEPAGDNPWDAYTLEWATTSPPPVHNFDRVPPVRGRRPLWDLNHPDQADWKGRRTRGGAHDLTTDSNKLGMLLFLGGEAIFFALLILAYLYYRGQWVTTGGPTAKVLDVGRTGVFSVFLFSSSLTIWLAERALRRGGQGLARLWLLATVVLGAIFLVGQGMEYAQLFRERIFISTGLFGTTFFTLTGFHGLHVFVGLVALSILLVLAVAGDFKGRRRVALETVSLYWHFVDAVWVVIFAIVYLWTLFS
jgi:cytochrome c oxidase subunit 1/cytochrome c oxidase subunit I+III